jgi:hypothetical protein
MTLWIFGNSMSLPYEVAETQGWPYLLSQQLGLPCKNFAQIAVDNFFIYNTFLENVQDIASNDIVIIGWAHTSKKTFVFDRGNAAHVEVLEHSSQFDTKQHKFIRSKINPEQKPNNKDKWADMKPMPSGSDFYDRWFENYYSEHEQRCNFQSYLDSVELRCPGVYVPFFFNKKSVNGLLINQAAGYILDFVLDTKLQIDENNLHLNPVGHELWAKHLKQYIDSDLNNLYNSNKTGHPRP